MEQKSRVGAREKTRKEGLMGLGIEVLRIQEGKKKKELKVGGKEFQLWRKQGVEKVRWAGKPGEARLLVVVW